MKDNGYKLTVTQLNEYVNSMLKQDMLLSHVCVCGEISGFKRHSSGHLYFSIKDENALVRCVMFRQNAYSLDFSPEDGQSVTVKGSVSLYVKDGQFQLYAESMRREGEGELYRRFMLLKTRLEAKGYFDAAHKKQIPRVPKCIGVVTSPTGAAIQDIINITQRRFPKMNIMLSPVRVQGSGAAEEIAEAIYAMNRLKKADVLIVGRGGGSMEDLWPFNEEVVAKAIFESDIPVVSAVGHETDFSIADFVADLRAPTPSAAAELCVPEYAKLKNDVLNCLYTIRTIGRNDIAALHRELAGIRKSSAFTAARHSLEMLKNSVVMSRREMSSTVRTEVINGFGHIEKQQAQIEALSPSRVLDRGYGMVQINGKYANSIDELETGCNAKLIMKGGSADITVKDINRG